MLLWGKEGSTETVPPRWGKNHVCDLREGVAVGKALLWCMCRLGSRPCGSMLADKRELEEGAFVVGVLSGYISNWWVRKLKHVR